MAIGGTAKRAAGWVVSKVVSLTSWIMKWIGMLAAYVSRYGIVTAFFVLVASACWLAWKFGWPEISGDLLVPNKTVPNQETPHATEYYAFNVIFLPLQTLLLFVASIYGWWTLRQNRRFKQHDVEARCISDYLTFEQRLHKTHDEKEFIANVRAYWTLILYEYYWWKSGLISRKLFTIWCEFRVQRFRDNPKYEFAATMNPTLHDYRGAFKFCRKNKVFRSRSGFTSLMAYLIKRAKDKRENLHWSEIERFRYGRDNF